MKQYILILSFFSFQFAACNLQSFAQQEALFSQYMFDRLLINPAYAGSADMLTGTLTYKNKFIGIDGAPATQVFSIHTPIQAKSMGVGLKAIHDKIGFTNQISVKAVYAYHLGLADGKLSFGLEGGFLNQSIDFAGLRRIDQVDNALPINKESVLVPDAAFGAYYHAERFFSGIAVYNLLQNKLNYTGYDRTPFAKLSNHYIITGGYIIRANENISLEPLLLIKYVHNAPVQTDININATYKEMLTLGSSFRTGDAIAIIVKYSFNDLSMGYAYDFTISKLSSYTRGSHEFMLAYTLPVKMFEKKVTEPVIEEVLPDELTLKPITVPDEDTTFVSETTPDEATIDTLLTDTSNIPEITSDETTIDTLSIDTTTYPPGLIIFEGKVTDEGIELRDVSVKLLKGHDVIKEIKTSEYGEFSFDILLTAGNYSLYVVKEGYIDKFYEITTTVDDDNRIIKRNFELVRKKF